MDRSTSELWAGLRELTDKAKAIADEITVVLVANRQRALSGNSQDRATEYFTDYEANQILTGLRTSGFRTFSFEGENEFISHVLNHQGHISNSRWTLIYNTAQAGTDPGRKSMVPAFCALNGLPTCNSNSYALSLARHKLHVHTILRHYGIPTPDTWAFDANAGWLRGERPPLDTVLIAKAGHESASIGLDESSVGVWSPEYEKILRQKSIDLGQQFIVQKLISGREFEVPVVSFAHAHEALPPVAITLNGNDKLGSQILTYAAIACDGFGFATCPPEYSCESLRMREAAAGVCEVLGLNGFSRVDFRMDDDRNVWVTDVSTSPHIVMHSAYWHNFHQAGWSHGDMLACMIAINAANLGWI